MHKGQTVTNSESNGETVAGVKSLKVRAFIRVQAERHNCDGVRTGRGDSGEVFVK